MGLPNAAMVSALWSSANKNKTFGFLFLSAARLVKPHSKAKHAQSSHWETICRILPCFIVFTLGYGLGETQGELFFTCLKPFLAKSAGLCHFLGMNAFDEE